MSDPIRVIGCDCGRHDATAAVQQAVDLAWNAGRVVELEGVVRAAVAEAYVISQVATSDPERVKMLAENLVRFLREAIER